jgi:hypothetical protein
MRVFGSGRPIGTGPSQPGAAGHSVELTVASVSPYATTTRIRSDQRATSSAGTVSVPTTSTAPAGSRQSCGRAATSDGGRIMCVTPCAVM